MRLKVNGEYLAPNNKIMSADEEDFEPTSEGGSDEFAEDDDGFNDTLDGIADDIEDLQDDMDDIEEDDVNIEVDNNIDGHYIAECDRCKGIFISAVSQSDQIVESIKGTCPLCGKDSEQYLRWVVKSVE